MRRTGRALRGGHLALLMIALLAISPAEPLKAEEVLFEQAVMAADHPLAARAGLEMLQKGRNAVDAAAAHRDLFVEAEDPDLPPESLSHKGILAVGVPGTVAGLSYAVEHYAIEPGKKPLSSMTPTMVLRDGRATHALGGSGGPQRACPFFANW